MYEFPPLQAPAPINTIGTNSKARHLPKIRFFKLFIIPPEKQAKVKTTLNYNTALFFSSRKKQRTCAER
jgi:hypothetical protein